MKKTLMLLQLLQLVCFSLETCQNLADIKSIRVIDKWWANGENVNVYDCGIVCYKQSIEQTQALAVNLHRYRYRNRNTLRGLVLHNSNITILSRLTNDDSYYHGIDLRDNFIESIKENVFSSCSDLIEVNLQQNNITSLPDRLFSSNEHLKIVDLSYNMIANIGTNTFSSRNINYLNLRHNNLQRLDFILPQNLLNLELSFNSISHIAKDSFSKLLYLKTLKLNNNALKTFNELLVSNYVDLSHNMISFIDNSTFSSNNIEYLNLQYNNLKILNFKLPENVLHLDMSFNSISHIAKVSFAELLHLKTLKLNNNALKTLPVGLFNTNNNLEEMDLSHNNITTVGKTTLLLHQIKNLNLQNNKLQALDFIFPISLIHLDLSSNVITVLNNDTFSGMTKLQTLKLNDNCLKNVPVDLLNSLDSLTEINLQHNSLNSVPSAFFVSNYNLTEANLGDNSIANIEESVFVSQNLERLNLGGNKIETLNFSLPASLQFLNLSFNKIDQIDESFFQKTLNVRQLLLNNNFLKNLPVNLWKILQKLEAIHLQHNSLTKIIDFSLNDKLNVTLDLSNNRISFIERNAFPPHGILNLFLQNNHLEKVNFKLPLSLVTLNLSYNAIAFIANDSFHELTSLLNLQLNNNQLQTLPPGCFQSLNNLIELHLSNNKITVTYGTFSGLKSLRVLAIANNSIIDLPELTLHNLEALTTLDVSNNLLTDLATMDIIIHLKRLRVLCLQGNRFQCYHLLEVITQFESGNVTVAKGDKFFESNVHGISCIDSNSTKETTKTPEVMSGGAEDVKRFLKEAIADLITERKSSLNSPNIDSNYLINLVKNMSDASEQLQNTLLELSTNLFSGNTSSDKRLQRTIEEIKAISNTSAIVLQHNLEAMNAQLKIALKDVSEDLKTSKNDFGNTSSEERLQHILEQINTNLVSNASDVTLEHILEKISSNLKSLGETQTKMLKEIQEHSSNPILSSNTSLLVNTQRKTLNDSFYVVPNASVLGKSAFLKVEQTDRSEDSSKNVESNNVNSVFQTIFLLGLFVTGAIMLYLQYMKFKANNTRQQLGSASLTEMSHMEL